MSALGLRRASGRIFRRGGGLSEGDVDAFAISGGVGFAKNPTGAPMDEALRGDIEGEFEEVSGPFNVDLIESLEGGAVVVEGGRMKDMCGGPLEEGFKGCEVTEVGRDKGEAGMIEIEADQLEGVAS